MSDQNTADNWRLEDTGKTDNQWKLQATEQSRIAQWQLQDDQYDDVGWQPVAYEREPRQQGGGWVLPSLVGLALVAVVAYGAWIGLTQIGNLDGLQIGSLISSATFTPIPTDSSAPAANPNEGVPTSTPTAEPPTPTPEPTATLPPQPSPTQAPALVDLTYARVTNQYGVNARSEPSTEATIVELLDFNAIYLMQTAQDGWLQVAIGDGTLAWISAEFAEQFTQQKPLAEANSELSSLGLPPLSAATVPTTTVSTTPLTDTASLTSTQGSTVTPTTPISTPVAAPGEAPVATTTLTGTVNITVGLNARAEPDANAALITIIAGNTVLTLTERTPDNTWLRTTISDSVTAWVFAQYITLAGDINTLPLQGSTVQGSAAITGTLLSTATTGVATAPAITSTTPTTNTTPGTGTTPSTGTTPTTAPEGATATVNTILGAGVRQAPDRDAEALTTLPFDRVYPVLARSADNEWVQIALEADQRGWVLVSTVNLSVDLATLPVATP